MASRLPLLAAYDSQMGAGTRLLAEFSGSRWPNPKRKFLSFFWGIIIGGIVLLVRFIFRKPGSKSSEDSLEILKKRYVRGEIGKEQFETMRRELM